MASNTATPPPRVLHAARVHAAEADLTITLQNFLSHPSPPPQTPWIFQSASTSLRAEIDSFAQRIARSPDDKADLRDLQRLARAVQPCSQYLLAEQLSVSVHAQLAAQAAATCVAVLADFVHLQSQAYAGNISQAFVAFLNVTRPPVEHYWRTARMDAIPQLATALHILVETDEQCARIAAPCLSDLFHISAHFVQLAATSSPGSATAADIARGAVGLAEVLVSIAAIVMRVSNVQHEQAALNRDLKRTVHQLLADCHAALGVDAQLCKDVDHVLKLLAP